MRSSKKQAIIFISLQVVSKSTISSTASKSHFNQPVLGNVTPPKHGT